MLCKDNLMVEGRKNLESLPKKMICQNQNQTFDDRFENNRLCGISIKNIQTLYLLMTHVKIAL